MLKKLTLMGVLSGGALLLANQEWDAWTKQSKERFSKSIAENRPKVEPKPALSKEDMLVIIGQALLELDKINAEIRRIRKNEGQKQNKTIEILNAQRIAIYNATVEQCGELLAQEVPLAEDLLVSAYVKI